MKMAMPIPTNARTPTTMPPIMPPLPFFDSSSTSSVYDCKGVGVDVHSAMGPTEVRSDQVKVYPDVQVEQSPFASHAVHLVTVLSSLALQQLPRQTPEEHDAEEIQEPPSDMLPSSNLVMTHLPELKVYPELHVSQLPVLLQPVQLVFPTLMLQQLLPRQSQEEHEEEEEQMPPSGVFNSTHLP
jgi:hypothetical protein